VIFRCRGVSKARTGLPREHHGLAGANALRESLAPRRHTGAEGPAPNDNGAQEPCSRQGVDVLLDVSELEVDRINPEVKDLRAPPTEPGSAAPIPGPATAGDSR
jgi:hypothetical protein